MPRPGTEYRSGDGMALYAYHRRPMNGHGKTIHETGQLSSG
jgi:hypothetical protein